MKYSILIPTNRPRLARRAIKAAFLAQLHRDARDVEILVSYSGNSEQEAKRLFKFCLNLGAPVSFYYNERFSMMENWKELYDRAKGTWVMFVPDKCIVADDIFEKFDSALKNYMFAFDMLTFPVRRTDEFIPPQQVRVLHCTKGLVWDIFKEHITHTNIFPHGCNALFRRVDGLQINEKASSPDYEFGYTHFIYGRTLTHTTDNFVRIPPDSRLEDSTGASVQYDPDGKIARKFLAKLTTVSVPHQWRDIPLAYVAADYRLTTNHSFYILVGVTYLEQIAYFAKTFQWKKLVAKLKTFAGYQFKVAALKRAFAYKLNGGNLDHKYIK